MYLGLRDGLAQRLLVTAAAQVHTFSCIMLVTALRGGYCQSRLTEEEVGVQRVEVTRLTSHS